ncbi:MAG: hypothetical protein JOS17DRAFT_727936 [Linnemannia elongata]|nr:MAG: hypothetical protein JOS17DRAFT_727936 [Linnemannia elongata]
MTRAKRSRIGCCRSGSLCGTYSPTKLPRPLLSVAWQLPLGTLLRHGRRTYRPVKQLNSVRRQLRTLIYHTILPFCLLWSFRFVIILPVFFFCSFWTSLLAFITRVLSVVRFFTRPTKSILPFIFLLRS